MIDVLKLGKTFPLQASQGQAQSVTALHDINLQIIKGSIVSLLGPTGCGKSTLLEILAGLQSPTTGEVRLEGLPFATPIPTDKKLLKAYQRQHRFLSPQANRLFHNRPRHDIAMVFQDYAVFPWKNVLDNVTFTLSIVGVPKQQSQEIALGYLDKVGLLSSKTKYPSQLSGGMKQRLAIARALCVQPKIMLLDEPFASVDELTRQQLQELLLHIASATKVTIVLVTHDVAEAVYLSDKIFLFTPTPGTIYKTIEVNSPRPRRRSDAELVALQNQISTSFR